MRAIDRVYIHCAATPNGKHFTVEDIDSWHRERGWGRDPLKARECGNQHLTSIGYHRVIYTDGRRVQGRCFQEIGAGVQGDNAKTIHICLVGTDKFTKEQWASLAEEYKFLNSELLGPHVTWLGHRDHPGVKKDCPGFDVRSWVASGCVPDDKNILQ